jgi:hypothetical protein
MCGVHGRSDRREHTEPTLPETAPLRRLVPSDEQRCTLWLQTHGVSECVLGAHPRMVFEPSVWDHFSKPEIVATCSSDTRDRGASRPIVRLRSLSEVEDGYVSARERRVPDTVERRIAGGQATRQGRALFPGLTSRATGGTRTRS